MPLRSSTRQSTRYLALAVAIAMLAAPAPVTAADGDLLRAAAASRLGVPSSTLTEEAIGSVDLLGRHYLVGHYSLEGGPAIAVVVDAQSRQAIGEVAFEQLLEEARDRHDKLAPTARAALADGSSHQVGFYLGGLDYGDVVAEVQAAHPEVKWEEGAPASGDLETMRTIRKELMLAKVAVVRKATAAFVADAERLTGHGATAYDLAPIVIIEATADQVERLAARDDVASVRLSVPPEPAMGSPYVDIQADYAHGALGLSGAGVRLGLVEYGKIDWAAPNLAAVGAAKTLLYVTGNHPNFACTTTQPAGIALSTHWTRVASIAAGRSAGGGIGIAPSAHIVASSSGNNDTTSVDADRRIIKAVECAVLDNQGNADLISASLVQNVEETIGEVYFDYLAFEHQIPSVTAAGNQTAAGQQHCDDYVVRSPGSGWNVLTVGGMNDGNDSTIVWGNDEPWYQAATGSTPSYCYKEPPKEPWDAVNDRVKPEILAPAQTITVPSNGTQSGTSFATPMAAGAAALVIEQSPWLALQPEVVKAILVAGSRVHRVDPRGTETFSTALEGAGTLSPKWSSLLVEGETPGGTANLGGYGLNTLNSPGKQGGPCYVAPAAKDISFYGASGRKIRVVIVWSAHTANSSHVSTSSWRYANLNLTVLKPGGAGESAEATSHRNKAASNVEWFDFTVDSPGTHVARITTAGWGCEVPSERFGFAFVSFSLA